MTLLQGLDDVDWTALQHAYGPAGDVPGLLRGIAEGPDPGDDLDDLDVKIFHQGGFVCSAATKAVLPWAFWKVTGDLGPLIAAVEGCLEDGDAAAVLDHLADLGPLAAVHAARLRALLDVRDDWTRVMAAHAYQRITGDTGAAAATLSREVHELALGRYLPVRWAAMRYLAELGPGTPGVQGAARSLLDSDRRHHWDSGWRAFTEDRELRGLASRLLADPEDPATNHAE
ncbi:hypothetical protein ETD83_33200 [Actinomadura soli]|uniref:HEAT repeat domain-containing protein n=1 Tax=Actinomadura soli TaxID=2508997 RepID=A0A5C4J2E7_9ACTN|nr:hypothetical protein [Actinomadura soli]TMQ90933.1 hypothetical protein ETD83_33200 [Actinomadura soli]